MSRNSDRTSERDSGTDAETGTEADALLADLRAARDRLDRIEGKIDDVGERRVAAVAEARRRALDLLDRYEGSATGTGEFEAYVRFQEEFAELVEGLDDDLPAREQFEAAEDAIDKRRLSESDFDRVRDLLAAVGDVADLLEDRTAAREARGDARRAVRTRLSTVEERIQELERLRRLGEADLDAPVERIREPTEAYDDAVAEAFRRFRREASAADLLSFVESAAAYPLVGIRSPPDDLRAYVAAETDGETVADLLEYADYSNSKLAHYVDDPGALKRSVATHRTYLERLGPDPLTVGWPPPDAETLRFRARELVAVVGRFADEATAARTRRLREVADRDDYDRLRDAAEARAHLTDEERDRLRRGAVAESLDRLRRERERLRAALESDGGGE